MKTFNQFLRMIQESPEHNSYHSKNIMKPFSDILRAKLRELPSISIGQGRHYVHFQNQHHYFHKKNGVPEEISVVSHDHVHIYTDKGSGEIKHNHAFMVHHIKTHGELKTDQTYTDGSKQLWKQLINKNPRHIKFQVLHNNIPVDNVSHKNIEQKESEIWARNSDKFKNIRIRAYHDN